jgi:hypothetical protein
MVTKCEEASSRANATFIETALFFSREHPLPLPLPQHPLEKTKNKNKTF